MKLFSKITFICNLGFLLTLVLGFIEFHKRTNKLDDNVIPLPFVTGILVILGQFAIFINCIFCAIAFYKRFARKPIGVKRWLIITNMIFFLVQLYWFFIY